MFSLIALILAGATPTPPHPANNTTVGLYYSGQSAQAVALSTSADTSITLATWRITDGTLCGALAVAASRGVAVQVAYNGSSGTSDAQYIATRGIVASGGTVYACEFPKKIANNFMAADGDYTLMGSYYYSPTAVQIGAYSIAVSGTGTASISATTFATLIATGTITAVERRSTRLLANLIDDCGETRAAINARSGGRDARWANRDGRPYGPQAAASSDATTPGRGAYCRADHGQTLDDAGTTPLETPGVPGPRSLGSGVPQPRCDTRLVRPRASMPSTVFWRHPCRRRRHRGGVPPSGGRPRLRRPSAEYRGRTLPEYR